MPVGKPAPRLSNDVRRVCCALPGLTIHATPKAAFTSIKEAVMKTEGGCRRLTWQQAERKFPHNTLAASIRHPVDRAVSLWVNGVWSRPRNFSLGLYDIGIRPGMGFAEFVERLLAAEDWPNDHHATPQKYLLDGRPEVLLRFESLRKDWARLQRRFPALPSIKHRNASSRKMRDEAYRDTKSIKTLADLYAMDMEEFGYDS